MHFKATDVYDYYKPSECARRVALYARSEPEQETDTPFNDLLRNLGHRHEVRHLAALPAPLDLSSPDQAERERATLRAIRDGAAAIYQPRFRLELSIDGEPIELVGEPDFLIRDAASGGYRIRDSKLARSIFAKRHRGIRLQLQIYGFLYERLVGQRPVELEVHAGTDAIVPVPYEGEVAVLGALREQLHLRAIDPSEYEPVGWTKCNGCGFHDRCWDEAKALDDVALLTAVDQRRALALRARGIATIHALPAAIDNPAHTEYFREGKKNPRLKTFVAALRSSAEAFISGKPIPIAAPALPGPDDCVMLDLEGLPPYLDDLEKIYLWGIKDHRGGSPRFLPALAGFGAEGDRAGWNRFLAVCGSLLDERPDLRFVHWGTYERAGVERYVERFGDPSGAAGRILERLVDLLSLTRSSVVLPLPSYGLKVVEKFVGFDRKLTEYQGSLAMARYIEACETADPAARDAIMSEILAYNEEDLDATWAVLEWLRACR